MKRDDIPYADAEHEAMIRRLVDAMVAEDRREQRVILAQALGAAIKCRSDEQVARMEEEKGLR